MSETDRQTEKGVVLRNSLFLSVKPVLSVVLGLFFAGYLGRHLGVERYGNFTYALSFVTIFSVIGNFGINTVLQRECAAPGADVARLFMNSIYLKAGFLLLTVLAVIAAAFLLGPTPLIRNLIIVFSLYIVGLSLQNSFSAVFKGIRDARTIAVVDMSSQVIDVVFIVSILWLGGREIGIAWGKAVMMGAALAVYLYYFRRKFGLRFPPFEPPLAKRFLRSGAYITMITVFLPVYHQIGPVILGTVAGTMTVGIYQAANGFVDKLLMFASPFNDAVFPLMAGSRRKIGDENSEVDFHFYFTAILLLAAGAWIGTHYAGPMLVDLFFGEEYAGARAIIRILAIAVGIRFVNFFFETIFLARKNERISALLAFVQVAVNVIACAVLIPVYGGTGVAYAFVLAEGLKLGMGLFFMERIENLSLRSVMLKHRKIWCLVGVFAVINIVSAHMDMKAAYNLAFIPLYPVLMLLFGIMTWEDILLLKKKIF